jgi:intracellular septation protein A
VVPTGVSTRISTHGLITEPSSSGHDGNMSRQPYVPATADRATPGKPRPSVVRFTVLLRSMLWDVLPALAVYCGARAAGAGPVVALIGGSTCAAIRMIWVALRQRRIDGFSILVLLGFAVGLALSLFFQSPGAVLLKDSVTTTIAGLVFLISALIGRPLTFEAVLRGAGDDAEHLAELRTRWADEFSFRRRFTVASVVWGVGLIGEALVRVPLVLALSADHAVLGSNLLGAGVIGSLFGWSAWYRRRAQAGRDVAPVSSGGAARR